MKPERRLSLAEKLKASMASAFGGGKMKFHMFQPSQLKYGDEAAEGSAGSGANRPLFAEAPGPIPSLPPPPPPSLPPPSGMIFEEGRRLITEIHGTGPAKAKKKRKAAAPIAEAPGPKTFKFVDCTADAVAAVEAANRIEDVAPEGFARSPFLQVYTKA